MKQEIFKNIFLSICNFFVIFKILPHEYNYLTFLPFENVNVESLQFIWSSIEDMHDIVALGALLHFISWFHSYSFHFQRPLSECWSPNLLH